MSGEVLVRAAGLRPDLGERRTPPLDCTVSRGSITCLLGHDSEQRTAYLRALAAVDPALGGRSEILGVDGMDLSTEEWRELRRTAAFVTWAVPLLSVLDGFQNLLLPAQYHQVGSDREIKAEARALLGEMEYDADHGILPAYMSDLQRRLLGIARAMILHPALLFLDEPFHGLDIEARNRVCAYLTGPVRRRGVTLVVACSELPFARRFADRVILVAPEAALSFDSWKAFAGSTEESVRRFLELERRACVFDTD